jgi:hypothetical protein
MQAARLLELQRDFLRDAEAEAPADHVQVRCARQSRHCTVPVEQPRVFQLHGTTLERVQQSLIRGPARDQMHYRGQRRDVRLGRRDAHLDACTQRHEVIRHGCKGRIDLIAQRDHQRAATLRGLGRGEQVRALAGLRDRDEHDAAQIRLRFVQRAQRRCGGGGEDLRVRLDQIFRERRRVVRAATRASDDSVRLHLPQHRTDARKARCIRLHLLADNVGSLRRLTIHSARPAHVVALSSATKS